MKNVTQEPLQPEDPIEPEEAFEPREGMQQRPSVIRRHPFAFGVAGVLVGAAIVSGLTAWGVASAVENAGTMAVAASPMPSMSAVPQAVKPAKARGAIRGTITAINGSTWIVLTKAGPTVMVTVTSSTVFGTKQAPSTATAFTTGSSVAVLGTRTGDSLIATRIVTAKNGAGVTPTPSASPNT